MTCQKQEKSNLNKRKPETQKKPETDDRKTIFDRIKPTEGAENHVGNKKQGAPYHQQQKPQHFRKNEPRQPDADKLPEDPNATQDSQVEDGMRQAKLQNFLSKFKKVLQPYNSKRNASIFRIARTPLASSFIQKRTALGFRSVYMEKPASIFILK